jgi:hypothetical protein
MILASKHLATPQRGNARATTPRGTCTAEEGLDAETFRNPQTPADSNIRDFEILMCFWLTQPRDFRAKMRHTAGTQRPVTWPDRLGRRHST